MQARFARLLSITSVAAIVALGGFSLAPSVTAQLAPAQPADAQPAKPAGQPTGPRVDRPNGEAGGPGAGGPGGRRADSVEGAMKGMNRALKGLNAQIADPAKKDDNLKLISSLQRNVVNAKDLPVPEGIMKLAKDDTQRAKLSETYRKNLIALMRKLLDLEEDVAAGKTSEAKAKLAEIQKMQDAGHADMGME